MNKLPFRILVISIIITALVLSLFVFINKNKKVTESQPSTINSLTKNQTEKPDQPNDITIKSRVADFLNNLFVDKNKIVTKDQSSTFNSLIKNQTEKPNQPTNANVDTTIYDIFDKYGDELKNVPYGLNTFLLGLSIMEFNHEAVWDYTKIPFWAEIKSVSKDTSSLTLKFISPKSIPYLNEEKEVSVVGCEKYNSFLTIKDPISIQADLDFFAKIVYGDDMIGYCLDQQCDQVGRLCKLYRD